MQAHEYWGTNWGKLSRTERDASYNNAAAVPNSAWWVEGWKRDSAAFRVENSGHLDLDYGPGDRRKWDIYPAKDAAAPCLIFIHGGYWQRNGREMFACMAEGALARGWSAALPSHTLAPDASLMEIVAEIHEGLDWLAVHGPHHGIGGPKVLSGWSAGGHLTAMAMDHPSIAAGLAISGVYELGPIRDTYLDEKLRLTDAEIASLSPLRLPAAPKPMSIAYGTRELPPLVNDSRDLHALRASAHRDGALHPAAGCHHFDILDGLRSADGLLMRAAADVLAMAR